MAWLCKFIFFALQLNSKAEDIPWDGQVILGAKEKMSKGKWQKILNTAMKRNSTTHTLIQWRVQGKGQHCSELQ